jgi:hypothetical protein
MGSDFHSRKSKSNHPDITFFYSSFGESLAMEKCQMGSTTMITGERNVKICSGQKAEDNS